jgi:hypothetical protein
MVKLHRYTADPQTTEPTVIEFDSMAELLADVRANDGLSDAEFYALLMERTLIKSTSGLVIPQTY